MISDVNEERPKNESKKKKKGKKRGSLMQLSWQVLLLRNKKSLVLFKHIVGLPNGYGLLIR